MAIAAFFLIFAVITFRLAAGLSGSAGIANFSPVAAVVLCGAAFLPKRFAIAIPLAAMLITDVLLNLRYDAAFFTVGTLLRYLGFAAIFLFGLQLRNPESRGPFAWKLFAGSIVGTLVFYVLGNTGAWLSSPGYAKTLAGWWQSQTLGLAPFPPSYLFLRNSLLGDLFFTGLFAACFAYVARGAKTQTSTELDGATATH
ncbi:MAG: DUF6580 family putative transport protein [Verrucomicrobiales bacterium]